MALYLPSPEVHAAYLASGITRYHYGEVQAAIADAEQALGEYNSAVQAAYELTIPFRLSAPGTIYDHAVADDAPPAILTLAELLSHGDLGFYDFHLSHHSSEALPLKKLGTQVARHRAFTRRLRKAISAAHKG